MVQHLLVGYLLGADFLLQHKAVIDCGTNNLQLDAMHTLITSTDSSSIGTVSVLDTMDIPSRSIMVILVTVDRKCTAHEVLIEPDGACNTPNHLLVAQSLSAVDSDNVVAVQVMNTSTKPVTLYKELRIASFTPWQGILAVTKQPQEAELPTNKETADEGTINLQQLSVGPQLVQKQHDGLFTLLNQFSSLFSSADWLPSRTDAVKSHRTRQYINCSVAHLSR